MVLIDAVYVNNSGALVLLQYLVKEVDKGSVEYELLLDSRIEGKFSCNVQAYYVSGKERGRFYKTKGHEYTKVLCFANVPPPVRLSAKVYTYFHNVFLLSLPKRMPLKQKILSLLKRGYIWSKKMNTDVWFVQTSNTLDLLVSALGVNKGRVITCPFYDDRVFCGNGRSVKNERNDYSFVANYVPAKNHELLIESWILLAESKIFPVLHLTLSEYPLRIAKLLKKAEDVGARILNHGRCSLEEVASIYHKSKAVIYPSENESLGLGIIESVAEGCDLLAPNLAYINSLGEASSYFELNARSIANAVLKYEQGEKTETKIYMKNEIKKLINYIK